MPNTRVILTAHQPVYLPWLGLFHKIALADTFVFFDDVQYQDRDWNNRNQIKSANGPVMLTVPVFNKDHFDLKLKDVVIRNDMPWRRKHWKSISIAYAKSPHAKRYLPFFEDLYNKEWVKLSDLNEVMLKYFLAELGIKVSFSKLSDLGLTSQKSQLVLDMCLAQKADLYIFGEQGKNYADEAAFQAAGVRLEFQKYQHPTYTQPYGTFAPYMTVLDLLVNHGPSSLDVLMSGNMSRKVLADKHFAAALS